MADYDEGLTRMKPLFFGSLFLFLPVVWLAQSLPERTAVPLHDWPAPRQLRRSQVQGQQRVATPQFQLPGSVTADVLVFVPIAPCRLADTRPSQPYPALGTTPLASLTPRTLPIAGACGVPTGGIAESYSLNVTVVPPSGPLGGYLLVYPNPATPIPLVASLTWSPGTAYQTNAVITAASSDGSVNVVANSPTDVVVDINGYYAAPTDASDDTALGSGALASETGGTDNTAFGWEALFDNTSGANNVAVGGGALGLNTSGCCNVAVGTEAMLNNLSGNYNTAIGFTAGMHLSAGNVNIMIANEGTPLDDHVIRIGDFETSTYIAGIFGNTLSGASPVVINSSGQLGVEAVSSRRYKEDIQDMGDSSKGLLRLRPVTFHYKKPEADGSKPIEYGLIAEEVADVYPDLVIRGADGQIESVQYQKLPAMLLNELQKEHRNAEEQAQQQARHAQRQDETIKKLEARLAVLEAQLTNAAAKVTSDKALPSAAGGR
jgi:hypothetical protein